MRTRPVSSCVYPPPSSAPTLHTSDTCVGGARGSVAADQWSEGEVITGQNIRQLTAPLSKEQPISVAVWMALNWARVSMHMLTLVREWRKKKEATA